ncbi:hypothetical protein HDE_11494 [Halotydeus destructor]|nr:hypothetical protein HDE_11494 [Halotydeus destructor]
MEDAGSQVSFNFTICSEEEKEGNEDEPATVTEPESTGEEILSENQDAMLKFLRRTSRQSGKRRWKQLKNIFKLSRLGKPAKKEQATSTTDPVVQEPANGSSSSALKNSQVTQCPCCAAGNLHHSSQVTDETLDTNWSHLMQEADEILDSLVSQSGFHEKAGNEMSDILLPSPPQDTARDFAMSSISPRRFSGSRTIPKSSQPRSASVLQLPVNQPRPACALYSGRPPGGAAGLANSSFTRDVLSFPAKTCMSKYLKPAEIADAITVFQVRLFNAITTSELFHFVYIENRTLYSSPTIEALVAFNKRLVMLTVSAILTDEEEEERHRMLMVYIDVAEALKVNGNMMGLKCIMTALRSLPILMLKSSWTYVRQSGPNHYNEFLCLCNLDLDCRQSDTLLMSLESLCEQIAEGRTEGLEGQHWPNGESLGQWILAESSRDTSVVDKRQAASNASPRWRFWHLHAKKRNSSKCPATSLKASKPVLNSKSLPRRPNRVDHLAQCLEQWQKVSCKVKDDPCSGTGQLFLRFEKPMTIEACFARVKALNV